MSHALKLLSPETIEKAIDGPPAIRHDEPWGHLITVVVAAGVYRAHTVATHMIVTGAGGRIERSRRRVEVIGVPLYSDREDFAALVRELIAYAADLPGVTIAVNAAGMGSHFVNALRHGAPGLRCLNLQFGGTVPDEAKARRFVNPRAQAYVEASEAIKDGAARLSSAMADTMVRQWGDLPYAINEYGQYAVQPYQQMNTTPDLWDSFALAFLDGVDVVPAERDGGQPAQQYGGTDYHSTRGELARQVAQEHARSRAQSD